MGVVCVVVSRADEGVSLRRLALTECLCYLGELGDVEAEEEAVGAPRRHLHEVGQASAAPRALVASDKLRQTTTTTTRRVQVESKQVFSSSGFEMLKPGA